MSKGKCTVSGTADEAKGRIKEAAGVLTGDEGLESEGKADRIAGELKDKVELAKDKVEEVIDRAKETLHGE